ncbi:phospholipase [Lentibacillus kimchii]|uniref:Phospholipase n=1 Tax=Lentibacillus kimchii TaxID=1542911 RepID=A0ABW2US76_9BACI
MIRYNNRARPGRCVFPGYRFCGPNCSGPGPPVNMTDAACQAHDACLESGGSPCICDQLFIQHLQRLMNPYTKEGRQAGTMYYAMRIAARFRC